MTGMEFDLNFEAWFKNSTCWGRYNERPMLAKRLETRNNSKSRRFSHYLFFRNRLNSSCLLGSALGTWLPVSKPSHNELSRLL